VVSLQSIQITEVGTPTEPVTLADVKAWASVDHTDHDTLLTSMITGARQDVEQELGGVKLVESTALFYLNTTKDAENISQLPGALSLAHVSDLTVELVEDGETNEVQVLDEDYYFNGTLKIGSAARHLVSYTITPVVPTAIKEAIKMLVAYRYNNRGDQEKQHGIPEDIERKVSKYRQIWL
jgi:hypothetical protein